MIKYAIRFINKTAELQQNTGGYKVLLPIQWKTELESKGQQCHTIKIRLPFHTNTQQEFNVVMLLPTIYLC